MLRKVLAETNQKTKIEISLNIPGVITLCNDIEDFVTPYFLKGDFAANDIIDACAVLRGHFVAYDQEILDRHTYVLLSIPTKQLETAIHSWEHFPELLVFLRTTENKHTLAENIAERAAEELLIPELTR